ncbi:MAG: hypothetical protein D3904_10480 [Candidatus Electrothrix sp. EH2]|nr:hypothetical protein [Candidatus Electrothrix sp. EH2]
MYTTKSHKKMFRNQYRVFFFSVAVTIFLLTLTSAHAATQTGGKKITGIVKETPGISWPAGIWIIEDRRVKVTEQTVIKEGESKAVFGAKIIAKGRHIDGVFTAYELEVITDDVPVYANR